MAEHADAGPPTPLRVVIRGGQAALYLIIAAMLLLAAVVVFAGTISDLVEGRRGEPITDTGLFLLERVLLLFIIAELLLTLQLVDLGGRILVEPFMLIGLIAVVRRVLVLMAEAEGGERVEDTEFLVQIGALGGLALILALAIHLLRRSEPERPRIRTVTD